VNAKAGLTIGTVAGEVNIVQRASHIHASVLLLHGDDVAVLAIRAAQLEGVAS